MKTGIFLSYKGLGANLLHLSYCHEIAKKFGCLVHCDAAQALGKIKINLEEIELDFKEKKKKFDPKKVYGDIPNPTKL